MIGDQKREWREDLGPLHYQILTILGEWGKSLHYSRITQQVNQRTGLFTKKIEHQFKQGSVDRRLVELRRRGYVMLVSQGRYKITPEGVAHLEEEGLTKLMSELDAEEGKGLEVPTAPEGSQTFQRKRRGKKEVRAGKATDEKPQRTLEFFASGRFKVEEAHK